MICTLCLQGRSWLLVQKRSHQGDFLKENDSQLSVRCSTLYRSKLRAQFVEPFTLQGQLICCTLNLQGCFCSWDHPLLPFPSPINSFVEFLREIVISPEFQKKFEEEQAFETEGLIVNTKNLKPGLKRAAYFVDLHLKGKTAPKALQKGGFFSFLQFSYRPHLF